VSNRQEVKQFMENMQKTRASLLSELTDGIHIHTISASSTQVLDKAEEALKEEGFLIE
jgi:uncharacterized protein